MSQTGVCEVLAQARIRAVFLLLAASYVAFGAEVAGRVMDSANGQGIRGAMVTADRTVVRTDAEGRFRIPVSGNEVFARAYGYGRAAVALDAHSKAGVVLTLKPITPRAVLSVVLGRQQRGRPRAVLRLPEATPVNAVVIDVKGDLGYIHIARRLRWPTRLARLRQLRFAIGALLNAPPRKG